MIEVFKSAVGKGQLAKGSWQKALSDKQ